MVLTCLMATNKNQQGEPRITVLERQVQTLVQLWNNLLSKTMTWKNSYAKGTLGPMIRKRSKRMTTPSTPPKGEIEKDQRAAMP